MYEEFARVRANELRAASLTIEHRMRWSQIRTIERLEKALRVARIRLSTAGARVMRTN